MTTQPTIFFGRGNPMNAIEENQCAEIPVLQLSLDRRKSPREHFEMAKKLSVLRDEGVLILGSGNLI